MSKIKFLILFLFFIIAPKNYGMEVDKKSDKFDILIQVSVNAATQLIIDKDFDKAWVCFQKCFPENFQEEFSAGFQKAVDEEIKNVGLITERLKNSDIDLKEVFLQVCAKDIVANNEAEKKLLVKTNLFDLLGSFISGYFSQESILHFLKACEVIKEGLFQTKQLTDNQKGALEIGIARIYRAYGIISFKISKDKNYLEKSMVDYLEIINKFKCLKELPGYVYYTFTRELAEAFELLNQKDKALFWYKKATDYEEQIYTKPLTRQTMKILFTNFLEKTTGLFKYGMYLNKCERYQEALAKFEELLLETKEFSNLECLFEEGLLQDLMLREQNSITIICEIYSKIYKKNKKKEIKKNVLGLAKKISSRNVFRLAHYYQEKDSILFRNLLEEISKKEELANEKFDRPIKKYSDLITSLILEGELEKAFSIVEKCFPNKFEEELAEIPKKEISEDLKYIGKISKKINSLESLKKIFLSEMICKRSDSSELKTGNNLPIDKQSSISKNLKYSLFSFFNYLISPYFSLETNSHFLKICNIIAESLTNNSQEPSKDAMLTNLALGRAYGWYGRICFNMIEAEDAKIYLEKSIEYYLEMEKNTKILREIPCYFYNTLARELAEIYELLSRQKNALIWYEKSTNYRPCKYSSNIETAAFLEKCQGLYEYGMYLFKVGRYDQARENLENMLIETKKFNKLEFSIKGRNLERLLDEEKKAILTLNKIYLSLEKNEQSRVVLEKDIIDLSKKICYRNIVELASPYHHQNYNLYTKLLLEIIKNEDPDDDKDIKAQAYLYLIYYQLEHDMAQLALINLKTLLNFYGSSVLAKNDVYYLMAVTNCHIAHKKYLLKTEPYAKYINDSFVYIREILNEQNNFRIDPKDQTVKRTIKFLRERESNSQIPFFSLKCTEVLKKLKLLESSRSIV